MCEQVRGTCLWAGVVEGGKYMLKKNKAIVLVVKNLVRIKRRNYIGLSSILFSYRIIGWG